MDEKTELDVINATTWEDLNPDWLDDGDLTDRFAKSQFDVCPGCGKFEQLEILNVTLDDDQVIVLCRPCQWSTSGSNPTEAIERWNNRAR